MKVVAPLVAAALALLALPAEAGDNPLAGICATDAPFIQTDDLSGFWSPCAVKPGTVLFEATYLQNASAVGGTALAAYPMLDIRTGIVPHLEIVAHAPSQIAESGPHGLGLYPTTHFGYGARYTVAQSSKSAVAILGEVLPPTSRFDPTHVQSRYLLAVTSEYAVDKKITLGFAGSGLSSQTAGLGRVLPSFVFKTAYDATPTTQIATDIGTRILTRHGVAQSFGDISVNQSLHKRTIFNVGLGTTFNPVSNSKAQYLASGFNYKM